MEALRLARRDPDDRGPADPGAVRVMATRSGLRVRLPRAGDVERVLEDLSRAVVEAGGVRGGAVTVDAAGRALDAAVLRRMETLLLEHHGAALLQVVEGQADDGGPETGSPGSRARGRSRQGHRRVRGVAAHGEREQAPEGPAAVPAGAVPQRSGASGEDVAAAGRAEAADVASGRGAEGPAPGADGAVPVLARARPGPARAAADGMQGLRVDMTPTLLVRRTLRSGQRVRFNGNVVVLGDVNPGAEIIASGDIVVMGTLRGVAHAGATGSAEAIVAAFRLQPVQLRVGAVIGRAPDGHPARADAPEVARLRDGALVIERFLPQGSE